MLDAKIKREIANGTDRCPRTALRRPLAVRCFGIGVAILLGLPMTLQLCGLVQRPSFAEVAKIVWNSPKFWADLMPRLDAALSRSLGLKSLSIAILGEGAGPLSQGPYREVDSTDGLAYPSGSKNTTR
jgi:hypothetical protein